MNQAPYLLDKDIDSFDDAKTVYLRASQRIEEAKKFYLLDGHVSDHVHLLQQQSKLYHYLATFETEPKRKLAMETRRATLPCWLPNVRETWQRFALLSSSFRPSWLGLWS